MTRPSADVHDTVAAIWRATLHPDVVGQDEENFFDVGGESLAAAAIVSRIRNRLGVDVHLKDVFEAKTLGQLAARVSAAEPLRAEARRGLRRVDRRTPVRASIGQEWQYLLSEDPSQDHTEPFLIRIALRVSGSLDATRLRQALDLVSQRHDLLRTAFRREGDQVHQELIPDARVPLELVRPASDADPAAVQKLIEAETRGQFDRTAAPLARCTLLELADTEHILLFVIDHLICDGVSLSVLMADLSRAYAELARNPAYRLPEPAFQFADWAEWQREWLTGTEAAELIERWRERLGPDPRVVTTNYPAYTRPSYDRAERVSRMIEGDDVFALGRAARERGMTLQALMLAGFLAALRTEVADSDLCVVTTVANRSMPEAEQVFGPIAHDVYVRLAVSADDDVNQLATAAQHGTEDAVQYGLVPNITLMEKIWPEAGLELIDEPAFYFNLNRPWAGELRLGDADIRHIDLEPGIPMSGLECLVYHSGSALLVEVSGLSGAFPEGFISRFTDEAVRRLLDAVGPDEAERDETRAGRTG